MCVGGLGGMLYVVGGFCCVRMWVHVGACGYVCGYVCKSLCCIVHMWVHVGCVGICCCMRMWVHVGVCYANEYTVLYDWAPILAQ